LINLGFVRPNEAFSFAKNLEDVFHGESSGVDVAVVLKESGLIYKKDSESINFNSQYQPRWYLSHCGEKGITKECVTKVKKLWQLHPEKMNEVDQQMKHSVDLCK
ncbi:MAG: hypothetical protein ACK5V3_15950, partial [Bdellovibrionales bacterium]